MSTSIWTNDVVFDMQAMFPRQLYRTNNMSNLQHSIAAEARSQCGQDELETMH